MNNIPGAEKPDLYELPPIRERFSFLYLERCVINRHDSAITVSDARGTIHVPVAALGVVMLGPGSILVYGKMCHECVRIFRTRQGRLNAAYSL
jgi:CRISPR-associated protein Cas1